MTMLRANVRIGLLAGLILLAGGLSQARAEAGVKGDSR
jgi:hypothetical protein